jgi:hypothetical protein
VKPDESFSCDKAYYFLPKWLFGQMLKQTWVSGKVKRTFDCLRTDFLAGFGVERIKNFDGPTIELTLAQPA